MSRVNHSHLPCTAYAEMLYSCNQTSFLCCPREYRTSPHSCSRSFTDARTVYYSTGYWGETWAILGHVSNWNKSLLQQMDSHQQVSWISSEINHLQGLVQLLLWECQSLWQEHRNYLHALGLGQELDSPPPGNSTLFASYFEAESSEI